ncbi:MAG: ABC transporter permease [Flexilinea sp.]
MRPRDRKIQDDLKSNPTRSILVVLAIAVGLFAMGVIMTMYLSLPVDMRVGYERTNPANIYFRLSDFDNSLIKHVKNWDEVRDAMGSSTADLRVRDKDQVLHSVAVQAVSDDSWPINHLKLLEGTWPLAKGEVALENYKFDQLGLKIGDRVVFKTETGKEVLLTIRARVRDQSIGASNYNNVFMVPINAYISTGSLRLLDMSEEWNMLRIVVNGDANDQPWIEQVANAASTNLEKAGFQIYSTTISRQSAHPTADYADAIASILLLIGILVLFLSGTLTYNTISAILSSQMRQIGAMKTFGATYFQIVAMYMRLIFIYSLIALAIAIPTSFLIANICSEFLAEEINFEIQQKGIIWQTIILQIMLGLVIPQVAGFVPVSKGAKVSIRQALSGMNSGTGDDTKPSAGMTWMTRVFSRPTALSLRNTFRKKMRLFLTLFTLSLGGAIFIGTFNVIEAIDHHIISIGRYFQADLDVTTTVPYRSDRMIQSLSAISGVKMVEGWGAGSATLITDDDVDGPSVSVVAPPDDSALIFPKMKSGRWFIPGERNAIVLSERFHHSYPELKKGIRSPWM